MEKPTSVSAIVSFWLTAILSVLTMAGFGYTALRDNELRFSALEARLHGVEQHNRDWKQRAIDGEQRLREVSARFNSTVTMQSSDLERRIDNLERGLERIKFIDEVLDQLAIRVQASETYYRDQVVPLLHRSNALQEARKGMSGMK